MITKTKKTNEDLINEYQKSTDKIIKKHIADELYKRVHKLGMKVVNKIPKLGYDIREDLEQEMGLVFMRCMDKFDTSKNCKFSTYFCNACRYELNRLKRKQISHIDNTYYLEIDEILMSKPDNIEDKIDDNNSIEKIKEVLLRLKKEHKITEKQFDTIIEEHGFFNTDKKTRKEMALERDCSLQNIGFLYRKAVNKIREELEVEGVNSEIK